MSCKKYLALFAVALIIILGTKTSSTHAQSSQDDQIPSDLSLDLDLAQKDPAPAQKQIISSQTPQAQIVTDKGEQAVVTVKDEVPQEVKLQSTKEVENPEQTTSEQVVDKNVEEKPGQNNNGDFNNTAQPSGSNSSSKDVIPGTNIAEPDDNTAPLPSSSANPSTSSTPSGSSTENSVQPTNSPANTTNAIPPENGAAPSAVPSPGSSTENAAPKEESHPSSNSENTPQPASGNNDSGSSSESPAVQGVSK